MAEIDDQAVAWANANPNHPESKHMLAKAWARMNPQDPDSARILEKSSAALHQLRSQPQDNGHSVTDNLGQTSRQDASKVVQDFKNQSRDAFPGLQPENQKSIWESTKQNLPILGSVAASALAPEAGVLAGTALSTGGAAVGSAAKQLINNGSIQTGRTIQDAAIYGTLPSVVGAATSKLGSLLNVGADKAQQVAMGMKKYVPGAGTAAIDEGVRGTADGMRSKIADALDSSGSKVDALVGQLKGSVSSEPVANQVADYGIKRFQSPNGMSTDAGQGLIDDAYSRGSDISNRGEITPEDARSLAQSAEKAEGYSSQGAPKAAYQSQLARVEGKGYRDQLRQMGDEQGVDVSGGFSKLHKLLQGQKALNTPQTLDLNNPLYSLGKSALKATVASPPVMSYGAAGANAAGNALNGLDADSVRKLQLLLNTQGSGNQ